MCIGNNKYNWQSCIWWIKLKLYDIYKLSFFCFWNELKMNWTCQSQYFKMYIFSYTSKNIWMVFRKYFGRCYTELLLFSWVSFMSWIPHLVGKHKCSSVEFQNYLQEELICTFTRFERVRIKLLVDYVIYKIIHKSIVFLYWIPIEF